MFLHEAGPPNYLNGRIMSAATTQPKSKAGTKGDENLTPERITKLTLELSKKMDVAIQEIERINRQSHMLAINARVESARAGEAGAAFGVVASEMGTLSHAITDLVDRLKKETSSDFKEIARINDHISTHFRGTRLSDLALTNIDLIDRNLYERSCDVRWWATDSSVVDALANDTIKAKDFACQRLGVILDSYTVYFDLVLCNSNGDIIANGRKGKYDSIGKNVASSYWFRKAMECNAGEDYAWETVHKSQLVNDELVLVYTTAVRENGSNHGKILGALGIIFEYEALAQTIVESIPLTPEEEQLTRACIVDDKGLVLADSDHRNLEETILFEGKDDLFKENKGFVIEKVNQVDCCIAHARAPGYETYTTGWHSLIIQRL